MLLCTRFHKRGVLLHDVRVVGLFLLAVTILDIPQSFSQVISTPGDALSEPHLPGLTGSQALHRSLRSAMTQKEKQYRPRTHHFNADGTPKYVNRLILESSPYLLQHAHNPVNWHPWSDAAFERARRLQRPVLLSVGYATCHWCHVMERESFEDVEIARYINTHFVAIKVDREERPDIDDIYMSAVHLLHGRGGWPMTVVMTPDREPFFGGTYFPARDGDRGARKGFLTILREIHQRYQDDPNGVVRDARRITQRIRALSRPQRPGTVPDASAIQNAVEVFTHRFDSRWGGFGQRPKFPRPVALDFLMRYHRRTGDSQAMHMVSHTLERMAAGGIYDHVGGGFHRYAVDARWLVPHFEKMLYDNAQLAIAYLDAYQITQNERFREVTRATLDYVLREMTHPQGGYYSATDADSETPSGDREEGWFFTWTMDELSQVVGEQAIGILRMVYGLTDTGNFEGRNILYLPRAVSTSAQRLGMTTSALEAEIDRLNRALYAERAKRPPPLLDDKVIVAWNGLMISAMARAGRVLGVARYVRSAETAAQFLLDHVSQPNGRLMRTWRSGESKLNGYLEDYAFLIAGLLDVYESTGQQKWFEHAVHLQKIQDRHYGDGYGYYTTSDDHETLLTREKPHYDGAQPAGNSISAMNLLRFYVFTSDESYLKKADGIFSAFQQKLLRQGARHPALLAALEMRLDSPLQVMVIAPREQELGYFDQVLRRHYLPNKALLRVTEVSASTQAKMVPLLADKVAKNGRPTAYVCEENVCQKPTSDPMELNQQLMRMRLLFGEGQRDVLKTP